MLSVAVRERDQRCLPGRTLSGQSGALQNAQRSPVLENARSSSAYSRQASSPLTVPPPPDTPPPLGCAYNGSSRTSDSMSTQSSARSSPALSPYSPSFPALHSGRAIQPYGDLTYPRRTLSGHSNGSSQWEMRSVSGPDSPDYDDMPSPTASSGYPHTDSDDAPSPASSATSHHTYSPHDGSQSAVNYEYYQDQSSNIVASTYPSSRQAGAFGEHYRQR